MGKLPAFQFYPGDWIKDPGVRACSLASRGLWFDLLCYMHQSPKYGYFLAGGQTPTDDEASRILGCTVHDYQTCLAELERFSVFSRTKNGVIFSRRMIRDEAQRKAWRDRQNRHRVTKKDTKQEQIQDNTGNECHGDVTHDVTPLSRLSSSSSSSSSSEIKRQKKKKAQAPLVLPDWIPQEKWNDFLEMRKSIRKPATQKAQELIVSDLTKFKGEGYDPIAILDKSIKNSWRDVYEPKDGGRDGQHGNGKRRPNLFLQPVREEVRPGNIGGLEAGIGAPPGSPSEAGGARGDGELFQDADAGGPDREDKRSDTKH
jgi:hypothetical protein